MYDPAHPMQQEIDAFLNRIFPDAEVKHWLLNVFANMIEPVSFRDPAIYIWVGAGANGKTSLLRLLEVACGSYIAKVNKEILSTGGYLKKDYYMSAAHRQMLVVEDGTDCQIRIENVRKLLQCEPYNIGSNSAHCHQSLGAPCGDIHILCNAVPRFEGNDNTLVGKRIHVIPFTQTFRGSLIESVNSMWGPYFWHRLVHIYGERIDHQTSIPAAIIEAASYYYPLKNSFEQFADERLRVRDEPQTTTMDDIVKEYRTWMTGQPNPGRRLKSDEIYAALFKNFPLRIEEGMIKNLAII
jgi:phage/plasmid-associated DNA primase